ncbi:MAG: UPF0280 family protein [Rhodobacteraceae bacterium]|nr:UPF0280 family protein [Paracoccaceae bacterium]
MKSSPWSESVTARLLPDGRRLHLQHGPIDLIVEAFGEQTEVSRAYDQAVEAFHDILPNLASELPNLRTAAGPEPIGPVAVRMWQATTPFSPTFITPMAAVAGSVADFVLEKLSRGRILTKAYVNNGGDIALLLREGTFRIGICENPQTAAAGGSVTLRPEDGIGGLATSGWRGRSLSLGIADAVTVLAETAAQADAAATLIANAVDLPGSCKVAREPASSLSPDSDLGDRLVTTHVDALTSEEISAALAKGVEIAEGYCARGLITSAYLSLCAERRVVAQNQNEQNHLREAICA